MVYTRDNPTGKTLHWLQSPDGTRTWRISPGHYSEWGPLFNSRTPLNEAQLKQLAADAAGQGSPHAARRPGAGPGRRRRLRPAAGLQGVSDGVPAAVEAGRPDLDAPLHHAQPSTWTRCCPRSVAARSSCPSAERGTTDLVLVLDPVPDGEDAATAHAEHALQAAEAAGHHRQPAIGLRLSRAAALPRLAADAAEHGPQHAVGRGGRHGLRAPTSWDVRDRFESVETHRCTRPGSRAAAVAAGASGSRRRAVQSAQLASGRPGACSSCPPGSRPAGVRVPGGRRRPDALPRRAAVAWDRRRRTLEAEARRPRRADRAAARDHRDHATTRPRSIRKTGALCSLQAEAVRPRGARRAGAAGGRARRRRPQHAAAAATRKRLADSGQLPRDRDRDEPGRWPRWSTIAVHVPRRRRSRGRRSTSTRTRPRIDFDAELNDIPEQDGRGRRVPAGSRRSAKSAAAFPTGSRTGPGASRIPSCPATPTASRPPSAGRIISSADGGGVALLDRGLPGRELTGNTPVLFLLNAQDTYLGYPCAWLSGKGRSEASFALRGPRGRLDATPASRSMAWEYNCPPVVVPGVGSRRRQAVHRDLRQRDRRGGPPRGRRDRAALGRMPRAWPARPRSRVHCRTGRPR